MSKKLKNWLLFTSKCVILLGDNHNIFMNFNLIACNYSLGETNYNLKDAQELKVKLTKLAENVDSIRYGFWCNSFN